MLKSLDTLGSLKGKVVLVRCTFDVPTTNGVVEPAQAWRLEATLPFLRELSAQGAKAVLVGHKGRPGGQSKEEFSLVPVYNYLKNELGDNLLFTEKIVEAKPEIEALAEGQLLILENLRFLPGEEEKSDGFAQKLAALADVYINNDFATSHRDHASITLLPKLLPYAAGPLVVNEVSELEAAINYKGQDLMLVMGGAKGETKLKVLDNFLRNTNQVLVGGVLANTLLKVQGFKVGKSLIDENLYDAKDINLSSSYLTLPVDVIVSQSLEEPEGLFSTKSVEEVSRGDYIVDVGPKTIELYQQKLASARRVIWNGPLGIVETPEFRAGSQAFAKAFVSLSANTLVGGGDIVGFLGEEDLLEKIGHVSTGGGSMLAFLAGEELAGLKALGYYDGQQP